VFAAQHRHTDLRESRAILATPLPHVKKGR
jgi:hypothetical protein